MTTSSRSEETLALLWRLSSRLRDTLLTRFWQLQGSLTLQALGVKGGAGARYYGMPVITLALGSSIELGPRVVLCSHPRFTALGVTRPVVLRTLRANARIRIGADVGISGGVICAASSVDIGNQCLFGADVQIWDTDFHPIAAANRRTENRPEYISSEPVIIEDNVFLGAGVRVLKGVRIGRNSVVGAGSIVTNDVPNDVIAAGVPARVIGPLPS
jgi:acetyltransferase-like isoleucine patch superfamily enzyme